MKVVNKVVILLNFILLFNIINCHFKQQPIFKCEHNIEEEQNPLPNIEVKTSNKAKEDLRRRIDAETDADGFKEFNIFLDLENIKYDIQRFGLQEHEEFFTSSMQKAVDVLKTLLKVRPLKKDYALSNANFGQLNIVKWNESTFGDAANNAHKNFRSEGIDLAIFGMLSNELGDSTLATASAKAFQNTTDLVDSDGKGNGQPYVGLVKINRKIDYSLPNSKEYFQAILVHEFTHILGFSKNFFEKYYNNIVTREDSHGIMRSYLNSPKLLEVARKYYNCPTLQGVELENQGGNGTEGSHWETRILLGEYMNGYAYTEEMIISEFTLAVLEDSGYYKAKYYTGGLMRFGKHKGCEFLEERCIDPVTHKMNEKFGNEFFDSISKRIDYPDYSNDLDASCSSGRLSRTYNIFWEVDNTTYIPDEYNYYENPKLTGYLPADYCPVPMKYQYEENMAYFSGHCSNKGSGIYGGILNYYSNNFNSSSVLLASATGEKLSENSFCFLSSLSKSSLSNSDFISNVVRANCYEIFCSEKSLTLKIFDDYIVCPRAGGKVKVEGYKGYLLCPDYNLMCSGTVVCNDMFDCIEKQSEIKDTEYTYDYEIRTSQNIEKSKKEELATDAYELTTNGKCPLNCKQCKEGGKCIKCGDDFDFALEDDGTIKCLSKKFLSTGYFKNTTTNIYEKCMDNCLFCPDKNSCEGCDKDYIYKEKDKENSCEYNPDKAIPYCFSYDEQYKCIKCNPTYGFNQTDRSKCLSLETNLSNYYTKDNLSYIPCSSNDEKCDKCYYEPSDYNIICQQCIDDLILLIEKGEENSCVPKEEIKNKTRYYIINETHAGICGDVLDNCISCTNDTYCLKCQFGYKLITEDINGTEIGYCLNKTEAKAYENQKKNSDENYDDEEEEEVDNSNYFSIVDILMLQTIYIIFLLIKF